MRRVLHVCATVTCTYMQSGVRSPSGRMGSAARRDHWARRAVPAGSVRGSQPREGRVLLPAASTRAKNGVIRAEVATGDRVAEKTAPKPSTPATILGDVVGSPAL